MEQAPKILTISSLAENVVDKVKSKEESILVEVIIICLPKPVPGVKEKEKLLEENATYASPKKSFLESSSLPLR